MMMNKKYEMKLVAEIDTLKLRLALAKVSGRFDKHFIKELEDELYWKEHELHYEVRELY